MSKTKAALQAELKRLKAKRSSGGRPKSGVPKYKYPSGVTKVARTKAAVRDASGDSLGQTIGGHAGRFLGGVAQKAFKALTGFGDYKVAENTIAMGTSPPMFRDGKRTNIIQHREYIADVLSSVSFVNTQYPLNPGQQQTFPWASALAQNYEEYRIHGMVWEFKSTAGNAISSTNNALGVVIMATEYNSLNLPFASKLEMENYQFCTSAKPSESFLHPVECARGENVLSSLYVRSGAVPATADKRFYDLGNFQIATQGMQLAGVTVGELWCTYEIELIKPRIVAAIGGSVLSDHYAWSLAQANTISAANGPFGNVAISTPFLPVTGSSLGSTITTGGTITFPPGIIAAGEQVLVTYQAGASASGTISTTFTAPTPGACFSVVPFWSRRTATYNSQTAGSSSQQWTQFVLLRNGITPVGAADLQVTLVSAGMPGTMTNCDVVVCILNNSLQTRRQAYPVEPVRSLEFKGENPDSPEEIDSEALEYEEFIKYKAAKAAFKAGPPDDDAGFDMMQPPCRTPLSLKLPSRK